jgi:hypothetical protein
VTLRFRTETGSVYEIDGDCWHSTSVSTRTKDGVFLTHTPILVGESVVFTCPPLVEGFDYRVIATSPVTEILEPEYAI